MGIYSSFIIHFVFYIDKCFLFYVRLNTIPTDHSLVFTDNSIFIYFGYDWNFILG